MGPIACLLCQEHRERFDIARNAQRLASLLKLRALDVSDAPRRVSSGSAPGRALTETVRAPQDRSALRATTVTQL
jgi:hypothetical protein